MEEFNPSKQKIIRTGFAMVMLVAVLQVLSGGDREILPKWLQLQFVVS
jgi:hypothetical protein